MKTGIRVLVSLSAFATCACLQDRAPASSAPAEKRAAPIRGTVRLDSAISLARVKTGDVLFIIARESTGGGREGPLVAAQRHAKPSLPLEFELSEKDLMLPGKTFNGPMIISARLDHDGDPMTQGEDDLFGAFSDPVTAGQSNVELVLRDGAIAGAQDLEKR